MHIDIVEMQLLYVHIQGSASFFWSERWVVQK